MELDSSETPTSENTPAGDSRPAFSYGETDEAAALASYRSVSVPAIVGLVLGLLSPLALVAPLLVVVPLAAVAVSLFALMRIERSEGASVGVPMALLGLFLGGFCVSLGPVRSIVREQTLASQATPIAQEWLELMLAGDFDAAFEMTTDVLGSSQPPPPGPPGSPPPKTARELFDESEAAKLLAEIGKEGSPVSDGLLVAERRNRGRYSVKLKYRLETSSGTAGRLLMTLHRSSGSRPSWRIASAEVPRF